MANTEIPSSKQRLGEATKKLREALILVEDQEQKWFVEKLSPTCTKKFTLWKASKKLSLPKKSEMQKERLMAAEHALKKKK